MNSSESVVLDVFRDICLGVLCLHDNVEIDHLQGTRRVLPIAHRDLKPENILFHNDHSGTGKLIPIIIDFGSMKPARTYVENSKTAITLQVSIKPILEYTYVSYNTSNMTIVQG
jgi:serine/threonine protein kinase